MKYLRFEFKLWKSLITRLFIILIIFSFNFCHKQTENNKISKEDLKKKYEEQLIKANKYLVKKDAEIIEGFIKQRNWKMTVSNSGLWYMVYKKGSGRKVKEGDLITLAYEVNLLDGSLCYSSDSAGLKTFTVGQGGVEAGLEEGVLYLSEGDQARFIMMPFLAYGLSGDMNKIPPRSSIIYEVEVKKLERNNK